MWRLTALMLQRRQIGSLMQIYTIGKKGLWGQPTVLNNGGIGKFQKKFKGVMV